MQERERKQRLFFALWPDDDVRRRIASVAVRVDAPGGKPQAVSNLHITLVFLGAMSAEQRACAEACAQGIVQAPFTLSLTHTGFFPKPRVVWLAADRQPPELLALVEGLGAGLERCGYRSEKRPYHAHITLFRKAPRPRASLQIEPIEWRVGQFCLVESVSVEGGVEYRVLREYSLGRRSL
ncbi:MAG: RNA 2',3'-cyclic phosphodiesterase [Gammaproteobacteria bacterium]